ncbi:hypothetical protein F4819DRAFT_476926 [Hypoxylon fuscum]|nr:hypothetical protein F4819DRAFT_476926 [Hypoxylon fuscum]
MDFNSQEGPASRSPIPISILSPAIPRVIAPDKRYLGWSDYSNRNWRHLTERTEKIWIKDPTSYNLGRGFEEPSNQGHDSSSAFNASLYRISNLHQLHCLSVLRTEYYRQLHNTTREQSEEEIVSDHMEHCIEYLRLSIMCGDGLVIESNSPPGTHPSLVADRWGKALGWGITRNCINWDNLMSWQRKAYDNARLSV